MKGGYHLKFTQYLKLLTLNRERGCIFGKSKGAWPRASLPLPMRGVFSMQRTWFLDPLCHLPNMTTPGEIQRLGNRLWISCGPIYISPNPKISHVLPYLESSTKVNLSIFFSIFFFFFWLH